MINYRIDVINDGQMVQPTQANNNISGGTEQNKSDKALMRTTGLIRAAGIGIGKSALNNTLSRIGQYTGSAGLQNNVNNIMKGVNNGITIAMGFAAAGIVGGAIATAYSAYDMILNSADYYNEINTENAKRSYYKDYVMASNSNNRQGGLL